MELALIVAKADNDVIGRANALPWHLPGELQYFKRVTLGKPVIMGRKTWESLRGPLPGRTNIVVTRQQGYQAEGVTVVQSLTEALRMAAETGAEEAMLIGGAELYRQALPQVQRMYITEVHADVGGDVWFPQVEWKHWREVRREEHPAVAPEQYAYSTVVYERLS